MVSTRLLFVSVVFLVLALFLSTSAAAEKITKSDKVVRIGSIFTIKNSGLIAVVNLEANQKLANSKLTISVPELGLRSRHNVDFSKKQKQVKYLEIQYPSGFDPYINIVFNSDEGRRVKYRPIIT